MKVAKRILSYLLYEKTRIRTKVSVLLWMKKKNRFRLIRSRIQEHLRRRQHIIIAENSKIGSLILPHPHNILIGRGVQIGENCTLYHDVTLGQNLDKFPRIGNNVIIYAGAKVIGGITIGDNVIIGANAVVTSDVPDNAIVAGIPAKIIKFRTEEDQYY